MDYTHPEVRELCYRFLEEVCRRFDVDGVEMDFFRPPCFFKGVAGGHASQVELDMMIGLLRRLRSMTRREGRRRGRPILIAIRVPDLVEYCRGIGLDLETWLQEGLVDILVGSGYFRLNRWDYSVAMGHKYSVSVYPCQRYRARALRAWAALTPFLEGGERSFTRFPASSPLHGALQVEGFQLVPLLKALQVPRIALLLADDVGLGKTIEAGLVLTELLQRRRIRRVVVACPASLCLQWHEELRAKFALDFDLVNRQTTHALRRRPRIGAGSLGTRNSRKIDSFSHSALVYGRIE